uniref:Ribosomal protein L23A n=1 Tax=Trepomonas sp. PC1 TaxID=1076344 RepID=A0A146KLQ0_9EUKA|eukprot:JAP96291.1 Ribosomal protein L23A [Trepomonas sp. PC1]
MAPHVTKAVRKAKALTSGAIRRQFKVRTGGCRFVNPATKNQPKQPAYPRVAIPDEEFDSSLNILRYPVRSEAINKLIENENTVVFIVRRQASKPEIAKAFNKVFQVKPTKVNTLITPLGDKKAFIKLPADVRAEDIAAGFTPK